MKYLIFLISAIFLIKSLVEVFIMTTLFRFSLRKLALAALLAATIFSLLTGCSSQQPQADSYADVSTDVAIILGNGANRSASMAQTAMNNYKVRNILDIVAEHGGSVTYIVNEQQPTVKSTNIEKVSAAYSKGQTKKIVQQRVEHLTQAAAQMKASSPQTNLIKCLHNADAYLENGGGKQKVILIIDQALTQTSGVLDFSQFNILQTDSSQVMQYLENEMLFCDSYLSLEDVMVDWFCFSATAAPQQDMTPASIAHMEQFWSDFMAKAKVKSLCINSSAEDNSADSYDMPQVSCVFIPEANPEQLLASAEKLDEAKLLFMPDSTNFANPAAAAEALAPYGTALSQSDKSIVVAGMCATSSNTENAAVLSLQRAQAVARHLCENYGIAENRLEIVGLGCGDNPFRVMDTNPDGSLNESSAKNNRCIIIADSLTEQAQQLRTAAVK